MYFSIKQKSRYNGHNTGCDGLKQLFYSNSRFPMPLIYNTKILCIHWYIHYSCFGPLKNFVFLVTVAILDGVQIYQISFRIETNQGPFLPSLVYTGPVV
jgi:hypothetical protein